MIGFWNNLKENIFITLHLGVGFVNMGQNLKAIKEMTDKIHYLKTISIAKPHKQKKKKSLQTRKIYLYFMLCIKD